MASNSAVLHPESYPYRMARAPINKPMPKIDLSISSVSLFNRIESK
uniref:Uncharacterized protein n=1 Tax=Rhizophora mucronata TaxID=61149 RepID=A0A2P2PCQ8_RHIMU